MSVDKGPIRVMIVDDSPTAALFLKQKFEILSAGEELEVDIAICESGEIAMDAAEKKHFDLFVLDIVLPGVDGYETCRAIKKDESQLAAFLSALNDDEAQAKAKESGCDQFIVKPASDMNIVDLLNRAASTSVQGSVSQ